MAEQSKSEADVHLAVVKAEIARLLKQRFNGTDFRCFFFGSRVEGKNRERSDIDVGIMGSRKLTLEELDEVREEMRRINTLLKIDVIDFRQTYQDFRDVALQHSEEIR
ncbi:MAG: nucleotidyltransferase domain-containing protein [Candidatus Liptonbacteria bacterium]|nr:nucleotidyltransferase domain-containing protein [Candidatus Liptonbacteria bacterium]